MKKVIAIFSLFAISSTVFALDSIQQDSENFNRSSYASQCRSLSIDLEGQWSDGSSANIYFRNVAAININGEQYHFLSFNGTEDYMGKFQRSWSVDTFQVSRVVYKGTKCLLQSIDPLTFQKIENVIGIDSLNSISVGNVSFSRRRDLF